MYLSLIFGNKEKLRIGLASVNGSSEGAGVRMLKRAASEVENQPALELSKRQRLLIYARGASPSMRERRINRKSLCTIKGSVARRGGKGDRANLRESAGLAVTLER